MVLPLPARVGVGDAAAVTEFNTEYLHQLAAEGRLAIQPDELGGTVLLADVLALEAQVRVRREAAMDELIDQRLWLAEGE
ncbi:MAG: hypothetical protein ACK5MT_22670 [Actinomycetales bacterium]